MNNKPHKHAELIKKWAEGAEIQIEFRPGEWTDCHNNSPRWESVSNYRVKPVVTTSLDNAVLRKTYYAMFGLPDCTSPEHQGRMNTALRAVADTAIKQYIKENPK